MIRSFIIITLLALTACHSTETQVTEQVGSVQEIDTSIFLTVNSVKKSYRIKKTNRMNFVKLQAFLDQYPTVPAVYSDTVMTDVTGDGIYETVISRITCDTKTCLVFSTVLSGDKVIFSDTLLPNEDLAFMDWYQDSIYFALKPYSVFYNALGNKNVVDEPENGHISEDLIEFYTGPIFDKLKETETDSVVINRMMDSTLRELRSYKGKYLSPLHHWDGDLYFWNRFTNRFELLYSP
jgi:hypothetical protein